MASRRFRWTSPSPPGLRRAGERRARFGMKLLKKLALLGVVALVGAALFVAPRVLDALDGRVRPPAREKRFGHVVAEGVRVDHPESPGADLLRCGSCRIEKMRKGPFTFGGINVLVLEDLQVTLPRSFVPKGDLPANEDGGVPARETLGSFGAVDKFLELHGLGGSFSGLHIERLEFLRLEGTNAVPFFSAATGEACSEGLEMTGFRLSAEEGFRPCKALLRVRPRPRIEWRGGSADLFPGARQGQSSAGPT